MNDSKTKRWIFPFCLFIVLGATRHAVSAYQDETPLAIGLRRTLHSKILNEDRPLSVRLPTDYARTKLSYPVVYLLYGDQTNGYFAETVFSLGRLEGGAEIPDFILIGIHNTDRYGDLLPVGDDGKPGGADRFIDFLEKELFPFIENEYRTKPFRLLIGPQAGAVFSFHVLARRPALFNAFILENPFWAGRENGAVVSAGLREYAAGRNGENRSIFINTFDQTGFQDHKETTQTLVDFLREFEAIKPAGCRIRRRHLESPTFVPMLELKEPFRWIFSGFYPPAGTVLNNLAEIRAYFGEAGRRFGLEIDPPAFFLAIKADEFSAGGRTAEAREVLEYAVGLRPEETNAVFRLGNAFLNAWELDRAEALFGQLQARRPDPFFASRLDIVSRMRKGSAAYALSLALADGLPAARTRLAGLERSKEAAIYFDEREFITLGYMLLGEDRLEPAIFVFETNARRCPESWNAHDSLGEAYAKAGRIADAIRSYERSLKINPKNESAKAALDRLRKL